MSARDDYPADGALGGTAELSDGHYEAAMDELDTFRAQAAIMPLMLQAAAVGQAAVEAGLTPGAIRYLIRCLDSLDHLVAGYVNSQIEPGTREPFVLTRDVQEALERFAVAIHDLNAMEPPNEVHPQA